ncbi:hypothetical protein MBLNU230_g5964t1 [Neophaeotheca triangularis]
MSSSMADAAGHSTPNSATTAPRPSPQDPRLHHPSFSPSFDRRPIPSPLQLSTTSRSVTDFDCQSATNTPSLPNRSASSASSPVSAGPLSPGGGARQPRPAKKAAAHPASDEIRAAVTRDAVREEARKAAIASNRAANNQSLQRNITAPTLSTVASSPPSSPTMASSSAKPTPVDALKSSAGDSRPMMARTGSIDSTVSTASSSTSTSLRANGTNAYRVNQDTTSPQDVTAMIEAAGSAEAALHKLVNEKSTAASHNAQLWKLVEKQRAMILGLNKDLEKALKEKERYRRKLKEHVVQSSSAPVLTGTGQQVEDAVSRDTSQSPSVVHSNEHVSLPASLRDMSLSSGKTNDTTISDWVSIEPRRSDTPQDTNNTPSSTVQGTPPPANITPVAHVPSRSNTVTPAPAVPVESKPATAATFHRVASSTPPLTPQAQHHPRSPKSQTNRGHEPKLSIDSNVSAISPTATAQSFSSPKSTSRKAPPAPLKLASPTTQPPATNVAEHSESEYEDNPESARDEQMARGRRKTREADDREREAIAIEEQEQEQEHRSRSKKKKKSKSKSKSKSKGKSSAIAEKRLGLEDVESNAEPVPLQVSETAACQSTGQPSAPQPLRHRAVSDVAGALPKSVTAPALMSPGLPMSPRPTDRPLNSPMPRAPTKALNSIPMSPKSGGLPMSPRAPRQTIPLPQQAPPAVSSTHLARAGSHSCRDPQPTGSTGNRVEPSPASSPDQERPLTTSTTSSSDTQKMPGEIYRGLMVEEFPDLLLPPHALPSVFVKTASSRMRPSRMSYIAPQQADANAVFCLAVFERSDKKQLWRIEKTYAALAQLDQQIKAVSKFRDRLPEKALFAGHSPAKIDARRMALDLFVDRMVDAIVDEKSANVFCRFLSSDVIPTEGGDYFTGASDGRPDTPLARSRPRKDGYLTKRGKNFGGWKARFFVLDGPNLKYFEGPGGGHLGSIKLQNAQIGKQSQTPNVQEDEENQFRHAFLILEPKRKDSSSLVRHVLCAESDAERDDWVDALLQYVDYKDDDEETPKAQPVGLKADTANTRGPRLQKSMNDLRPTSRDMFAAVAKHQDGVRTVNYSETVAGQAPVIGPPMNAYKVENPSPPFDGTFPVSEEHPGTHPTISAPTNATVIQNAGDWGMRPPPTPGLGKEKKRSIFGFRGRSSSDLDVNAKISAPIPINSDPAATSGRAVFGIPLAEAVEFAHPGDATTELPAVVYRCIEYLTAQDAIAEEGIFRLSGSNTVIKGLRERFNNEGDVNLIAEQTYYDIHAVASLLKLYLRELPSSILTRDLHIEFLQCLEHHGREKVVALNALVHRLPRCNRALLHALSGFLLAIVNNADVNRMNVRNVGIVFAPTLNVPAPLISSFVEDQNTIFGPPLDETGSTSSATEFQIPIMSNTNELRSPRKQMFSDLPTPAYNQTNFPNFNQAGREQQQQQHYSSEASAGAGVGMIPLRPTYAYHQTGGMGQYGDGNFGSLNSAMSPHESGARSKKRESAAQMLQRGPGQKSSLSRMKGETGGNSF